MYRWKDKIINQDTLDKLVATRELYFNNLTKIREDVSIKTFKKAEKNMYRCIDDINTLKSIQNKIINNGYPFRAIDFHISDSCKQYYDKLTLDLVKFENQKTYTTCVKELINSFINKINEEKEIWKVEYKHEGDKYLDYVKNQYSILQIELDNKFNNIYNSV